MVRDMRAVPFGLEDLSRLAEAAAPLLSLRLAATPFPGLSEPGRVRFDTNFTYYVKLISNLKWNVSFYGLLGQSPAKRLLGQ